MTCGTPLHFGHRQRTGRLSWLVGALAVLLTLSAPSLSPVAAQERIGVAAATVNDVTGSNGNRRVATGDAVFQDELIRTGVSGTASLLFRDETSLAIGPSSDVRLDRFVFNPSGSAKSLAVTVGTGAMRFVSGSSRPQSYQVNTPVATIGVRGTIFDVRVLPKFTVIVLTEGSVTITVGGRVFTLNKPGQMLVIRSNGQVEGPLPWDGRIYGLRGAIPWPLYGWDLSGNQSTPTSSTIPSDNPITFSPSAPD
jgi:ferric-dicitrate binding protein FerR (iron transport regulator)